MKLLFLYFAFTTIALCQEIKIEWKDNDGREFSIEAPNGKFTYQTLEGEYINYDYKGRVIKIGIVNINYDYRNKVIKIGNVNINYDYRGKVIKVGNLSVKYNYRGKIVSTKGRVSLK